MGSNELDVGIENVAKGELRAYVDNGEYATTWEFAIKLEGVADVNVQRRQAGAVNTVDNYEIKYDELNETASNIAHSDPQAAIAAAKNYYNSQNMQIPELVIERQADGRGRVNLGTDYAKLTVQIAVIETSEED